MCVFPYVERIIMINWSKLTKPTATPIIKKFAKQELSGEKVASAFKNTEFAGEFRSLVRTHGVKKARVLARKALKRRNAL